MKSYIQGLITGGVLVFAIVVLMGATESSEIGRYQIASTSDPNGRIYESVIDTRTGIIVSRTKASPTTLQDRKRRVDDFK